MPDIQTPDRYDAVLKAIDAYGTAQWAFGGAGHNDAAVAVCQKTRAALNMAIDEWAAARDAAIRRDERAECERDIRAERFVVPDEASRDAVQIVRSRFIAAIRARELGAVGSSTTARPEVPDAP